MIKYALLCFAKNVEKVLSQKDKPFSCTIIHSEIPDASRETKSSNVYIKPVSIQKDELNRRHRMSLTFIDKDDTHEKIEVLPCQLDLQMAINFYSGIDEFYQLLPSIYKGFIGDFNFSMQMNLGTNIENIPVNVIPNDGGAGTLAFPDFPNDPDTDRPQLLIDLKMTNLYLILGSKNIKRIQQFNKRTHIG